MRIINLNPDTGIGATSWFVEFEGHRLLLDAGTHPKREGQASLPLYGTIAREEVEAIAVSHCHHDHVGSLPVAMRHFPRAHVLLTELSYFLVERVLHNSVNVMEHQRDELGIPDYPLYTHDQVDDVAHLFQGYRYNREIEWAAFHKTRRGAISPTLEFFDAGHALGSAGMMVRGRRETLFFTGDACFHDQTILRAARFEGVQADVLIMESTRGGRRTPKGFSRESEIERLAESINRVTTNGGCVLLPVFALGRTQEMLAMLAILMREGRLKRQPVFIGGLGRVFTEIYDLQAHRTHRSHSQLQLTESLDLQVLDRTTLQKMRLKGGRIFVLTAGMMTENTAAHDLAARMIEDERQAVFFVGYADPESAGGRLKAARRGERFLFSPTAGEFTKRSEVDSFDLTAHANREDLLDFVGDVAPRVVVLGHGEADARAWFAAQIRARHPRVKVLQPGPGETVEV